MNPTERNRPGHGLLVGASALALAALAACGGGGGGGGPLTVTSTVFGFDPYTGNFDASGQQGEAPLIPLNMCVVFTFSDTIQASTANASSITVQEVDTSVTPPAPGPSAAVDFVVTGNRLTICPLITFGPTDASYGFNGGKTYEVLFQVPPSTSVITSSHGKSLAAQARGPYLFQTSSTVFDRVSGPPQPTMTLLDPVSNATLPTAGTPFKPVPNILITFNEPVIPGSVVDQVVKLGTSPSIHVELDRNGDPNTNPANDRVVLPGLFTLTETTTSATVLWKSLLTELPTSLVPAGCLYVVTVDGSVQDLAGNSKGLTKDVFTFVTAPGNSTSPATPVVEPFDNQNNKDSVTSAKWGTSTPGFLTEGIGGGTGVDGEFDPSNVALPLPSGVTINGKTVTMSTEKTSTTQRVYEFTKATIPPTFVVKASGKFPLLIETTGTFTVFGTIDISGAAGAVYSASTNPFLGGSPGAAAVGGAAGGRGGATQDSVGNNTFFSSSGAPSYAALAFFSSGQTNQGLSGRNTALDNTNSIVTDANHITGLNNLAGSTANLWIQPNVAADDYRFERTHPAFKVSSIANGTGAVTVVSNPADPNFRGELSQTTDNPYTENDGSGGFRTPLLAEPFDSYVIGELAGLPGSRAFDFPPLDTVTVNAKVSAGAGSDPQSVMQTFLTLGHSGGGGGGGGVLAGNKGDDDPTVAAGPGFFGGTGGFGAAGGAAAPTGNVAFVVDSDTIELTTNVFDDGAGNGDPAFVNHLINPNINQGNAFLIKSVDSNKRVTIFPIVRSSSTTPLDFSNTVIPVNATVRITPPYEAGGTGGGGAGVHCAGSNKTAAGHTGDPPLPTGSNDPPLVQDKAATVRFGIYDDDNKGVSPFTQNGQEDDSEAIFTLPKWIPGGGGGAGGGSLRVISAGDILVTASGIVRSDGGEGGRSDAVGTAAASGGGGGAGGTTYLGTGGTLSVALGGKISCAGGKGGAEGFGVRGGDGAAGRIRLENLLGNLVPSNFTGATTPSITFENLGFFPGGGSSLAQSIFISSGVLKPQYTKIVVIFTVDKKDAGNNVTTLTDAIYVVKSNGTVDQAASTIKTAPFAPFTMKTSFAPADATTGLVVPGSATAFLDPATLAGRIDAFTQGYLRFQIVVPDSISGFVIGTDTYTRLRVNSIEFDLNGVKP